ncbi:MAG: hypothetical protein AB1758_27370, partial [Candidatus Eremiobacterota bacterium]
LANQAPAAGQPPASDPAAEPAPPQPPPPPATPPENPTDPNLAHQVLANLTAQPEFTKKVMGGMGKGDQVTIVVNGQETLTIKSEGPSLAQRVINGTQMFITAAADEASQLVKADPAFAFKEAALGVKTQVYTGLPREVQTFADSAFLPMLRVAALVLDTKKFLDARANKDAALIDKIVDGAHVATDVVGLVGALGDKFIPALGPMSGTLTAIGLAGDIAAYSYHVLAYLRERGQVNFSQS